MIENLGFYLSFGFLFFSVSFLAIIQRLHINELNKDIQEWKDIVNMNKQYRADLRREPGSIEEQMRVGK